MTLKATQGGRASRQGRKFEAVVASILDTAGADYEQQFLIPGGHIYGRNKRVDFFVKNHAEYSKGLVLEIKWQESSGSADEKIPCAIECIKKYPFPTILILGGTGWSEGVLAWAKLQESSKLIHVMNNDHMLSWFMRNGFN